LYLEYIDRQEIFEYSENEYGDLTFASCNLDVFRRRIKRILAVLTWGL